MNNPVIRARPFSSGFCAVFFRRGKKNKQIQLERRKKHSVPGMPRARVAQTLMIEIEVEILKVPTPVHGNSGKIEMKTDTIGEVPIAPIIAPSVKVSVLDQVTHAP